MRSLTNSRESRPSGNGAAISAAPPLRYPEVPTSFGRLAGIFTVPPGLLRGDLAARDGLISVGRARRVAGREIVSLALNGRRAHHRHHRLSAENRSALIGGGPMSDIRIHIHASDHSHRLGAMGRAMACADGAGCTGGRTHRAIMGQGPPGSTARRLARACCAARGTRRHVPRLGR